MLPLGDSEAPRRLTAANTILILGNLAAFAVELRFARSGGAQLLRFAMVPAQLTQIDWRMPATAAHTLATLITSLFLHVGLLHLVGNMLYLFVFGPAVEARMGHGRYFEFYLAAGVTAGLATAMMAPQSRVPVVGASGAIAGILGAYFVLYPAARVTTVLPSRTVLRRAGIPAIFYLLVWFGLQLYSGIFSSSHGPLAGGVAWWAHVGGFLFGVALAPFFVKLPAKRRRRLPVNKRSAAS
jgi:membrane associated rhomboid family serine protease